MSEAPVRNKAQEAILGVLGNNLSTWVDKIYDELAAKDLFAHADAGPTVDEVKLAIRYAINDYHEASTHRGLGTNIVTTIHEALFKLGILKPQP